MSLTIDLGDDQNVQVSEQRFESRPPDRLDFVAEGVVRLTVETDGGSGDDVLAEFTLLGISVVIYRNGRIEIGTRGDAADVELS